MGLSASQARFLQLTARKSNVEYQAQRINYERLSLSKQLSQASQEYQEKTSNRKLVFSYRDGSGKTSIDLTYKNYKNYMNQQAGVNSQQQYYLVSSSGNKIIASSEEDMQAIIDQHNSQYDEDNWLTEDDFMFVDGLDDVDNFQRAIQDGIYYFATYNANPDEGAKFNTQEWETLGGGAITDVLDTSDDAQAEAEYKATQDKIQNADKKLELELNRLESEREAISTELESVQNVIKDNIEKSFQTFG